MLLIFHTEMRAKYVSFYLIIDEYDNFANNVLVEHSPETYQQITHSGGFLRNFFTMIKGLTDSRGIDRLFISGVTPMVMADITSGFNIGDNISLWPDFGSMAGFNRNELQEIIDYYIPGQFETLFPLLSEWYNNYCFDANFHENNIFNSTSILYFLKEYLSLKRIPSNLIDENLRTDYGKLRFLIIQDRKLNGNFNILSEIAETRQTVSTLVRSFALDELISDEKFKSLLFYLGFLTIEKIDFIENITFKIPNKLINNLIWDYIRKSISEFYSLDLKVDFLNNCFSQIALAGIWRPLFQYIIDKFYEAVSIRDFVFHEEGLITFLLAWLNLTNLYDVISEKEKNKGYADICLEPDRRFTQYVKFDYNIELKYIKAAEIETPEKEEVAINQAVQTATAQLSQYTTNDRFRTTKIIIVASAKKLLYIDCLE